ncbi:MAG: hypothetical protein ACK4L4_17365 [Gemmobacter sp.]
MTLIRPEVAAALTRWREVIAAGGVAMLGLWIAAQGGLILMPAGLALVLVAGAWAVTALRRMRFGQDVTAPGIVEVNEGQIAYLGPAFGGYAALEEVVEIRLVTMRGRRLWRLMQADGQVLLIPVDATGAAALFDAFAALPGIDMGEVIAALEGEGPAAQGAGLALGPQVRVVWRRRGVGVARA